MVSTELMRRYPFFGNLDQTQLSALARTAEELKVEAGYSFFEEGDELNKFYFIIDGKVSINLSVPDRSRKSYMADPVNGALHHKDVSSCTIESTEMFGWSALIPPHKSTAGAISSTPCRILAFDCDQLRQIFESDCQMAYALTLKAAQTVRERLRCLRVEVLAFMPA